MRWLWAAYQMDTWADLFAVNLTKDAFTEKVLEMLGAVDFDWIIDAKSENGMRPVGIVLGNFRAAGRGVEPHVEWFPWATPRNKLEGSATFLYEVGKRYKSFIYSTEDNTVFWDRVCLYRVLKRGCKIGEYFGPKEGAMMYYTPGPF